MLHERHYLALQALADATYPLKGSWQVQGFNNLNGRVAKTLVDNGLAEAITSQTPRLYKITKEGREFLKTTK